jgi:hypothetical protein
MDRAIEIVPAIKRVELRHVGCWQDLKLEFIPGLNIITEEGSAWGKTTIFEAILQSLIPTSQFTNPLSPTNGHEHGTISVELMSVTHNVELRSEHNALKPQHVQESRGQFMLRQLRSFLEAATPNTALLIEDEVTAILDSQLYVEAVEWLNSSHCQVICQIAHRLERSFPEARVYACYMQDQDKVGMKLQQLGGSNA